MYFEEADPDDEDVQDDEPYSRGHSVPMDRQVTVSISA